MICLTCSLARDAMESQRQESIVASDEEIGVLKQTDKISLCGFLKSENSMALETKVRLEILGNLTHKPLERKFPDQQFGTLLILANFTKSNSSWSESVGLLHTTVAWDGLTCSLHAQLLPWQLPQS